MSTNELQSQVNELRELRRMAAELEAEMESRRFDKARMIAAFGQDCYDQFCKTTTSRRFTISA